MRCIIIAGSPYIDFDFVEDFVKDDDFVICADKGYRYAMESGVKPNIIVGDFDSYTGNNFNNHETIPLSKHKDDTDTLHAIDIAFKRGFKLITILGGLGGRLDHTYANLSALQYIYEKGGWGVLLSEYERIEYLPKGEYEFNCLEGKTFSLFPFGCSEVCVSYEGAEYPLNRQYLKSNFPRGVSNVFTSDKAKINIYDGNAILMIILSNSVI
ncbi:MAG: thiamine diphosphokinase [Clostridiales bacterium]|nr:thiamine diphosphokinase [Clostridiales bacterium]